jgi:type I restriction enzyme R subunit
MNELFEGVGLTDNDMVGFSGYVGGKLDYNEHHRGARVSQRG